MTPAVQAPTTAATVARIGVELRTNADTPAQQGGAALQVPLNLDRLKLSPGQDVNLEAKAKALQAKAEKFAQSPLGGVAKSLMGSAADLLGKSRPEQAKAVNDAITKGANATFKAVTDLADRVNLRQPTAEQTAKANADADKVMATHDPLKTGFVQGKQLDAWTGGKAKATLDYSDKNRDGKLSREEIVSAYERKAMDKATTVSAGVKASKGGIAGGLEVKLNPGLNQGKVPRITGEINVGPDVLREVRAMAYHQTRQAIANRQAPEVSVPDVAIKALQKFGGMNTDHSLDGVLAVNLCSPALIEAVRSGVTAGIEDQPFRNRFLIRPQGMWRLRGAIANSRPVQRIITNTVSNEIGQVKREVSTLSNGMVVFQDIMPARTGANVTYHGQGIEAKLSGSVDDVSRLLKK